jgi:hypothetical protein
MKGVIELNWKILLIIIVTIVAFIIISIFVLGLHQGIVDFFSNFDPSKLVKIWKKITERK